MENPLSWTETDKKLYAVIYADNLEPEKNINKIKDFLLAHDCQFGADELEADLKQYRDNLNLKICGPSLVSILSNKYLNNKISGN